MNLHVVPEVYTGVSNARTDNVQRGSQYDCARVDDVKHKSVVVTLTRPACTEIPYNCSTLQTSLLYWFTKKASSVKVFLSLFEGSVPCTAEGAVVELLHLGGLSHRPPLYGCVSSSGSVELLCILLTHRRLFS